jgi:holo-[acyl-carrier protein] synthase
MEGVNAMINGLGTDIVDIARVDSAATQHGRRFAKRVLSSRELEAFDEFPEKRKIEFLAGRFAAKEAIAKAIGCGLSNLRMQEVDIQVGEKGLTINCEELAGRLISEGDRIHVSISHTASVAYAVAVWESACQGCT